MTADTGRPQILLVEADAPLRRSFQLLLHSEGYEVRAFARVEPLITDPTATRAACLIADDASCRHEGDKLLHRLRGRNWHGSAILLSDADRDDAAMTQAGFACILRKPLADHDLTDAVHQILSQKSSR